MGLRIERFELLDDWYVIEDERGRSPTWVSIEGTRSDMVALAEAVLAGEHFAAKRCAVSSPADGSVRLWSPRNELGRGHFVPVAVAMDMARAFLAVSPPPPAASADGGG